MAMGLIMHGQSFDKTVTSVSFSARDPYGSSQTRY